MLTPAGFSKILILSDGVPGHVNQARGLASWLCESYGWQRSEVVAEFAVELCHKPMRALYRTCLNAKLAFAPRLVRSGYPGIPSVTEGTLIISCGGNTSFINAALAQESGQPNLFIGSLRGLRPDCFKAVLTLEPVGPVENNVVMDFSPSYIDIDEIKLEAEQFLQQHRPKYPLWCLLVGGDGAGYQFQDTDWQQLAKGINQLAQQHGVRWLVTTSRRSGESAERILQSQAADAIFDAIWFSSQGNQSLESYLGAAERIFCTEDSMTMLSESINAGKPVVSLRPHQSQPNQRFVQALERFAANGYLQRVSISELESVAFDGQSRQHQPELSKSRVVDAVTRLLG